jgi:hypothetical protein
MSAEQIAAGLDYHEKFALKAILPGIFFGPYMAFELTPSEVRALWSLVEKGLARKRWKGWGYTPLGLEVRAILEQKP